MNNCIASQNSAKGKNKVQHKNKLGFIDPTVAGIDIGDKEIYVAIPDSKGEAIVKRFGTTTPQLHKQVYPEWILFEL